MKNVNTYPLVTYVMLNGFCMCFFDGSLKHPTLQSFQSVKEENYKPEFWSHFLLQVKRLIYLVPLVPCVVFHVPFSRDRSSYGIS